MPAPINGAALALQLLHDVELGQVLIGRGGSIGPLSDQDLAELVDELELELERTIVELERAPANVPGVYAWVVAL
jgi:hypothetical protein